MGNKVQTSVTAYTRLISKELDDLSHVQREQPRSILKNEGYIGSNTGSETDKPDQRSLNTRTIKTGLENTARYSTGKERCFHWWSSCYQAGCTGTQDCEWLRILVDGHLDYITKASDRELKAMGSDDLMNTWLFSIFVFASYREHNCKNNRDGILNDFLEVEGQLKILTKKLLLIVGPWFVGVLNVKRINSEDFCTLPAISFMDDYSSIPRKLRQYFSENDWPHLPGFIHDLLKIDWHKNAINELSEILSLNENEVNSLKRKGAAKIFSKVFSDASSRMLPNELSELLSGDLSDDFMPNKMEARLCQVSGRSGFPRLTGTNTCFIGTGLQLLSLLQPEIDNRLAELIKAEGRDLVRKLLTESRTLLALGQQCFEGKQKCYFRFIELLVQVQHQHDIKTLEKLPDLIESGTNFCRDGGSRSDYRYVRNIAQQDVVEFITCFLTNVVKLNASPACCIIRDFERVDSSSSAVKLEPGGSQLILDVPLPENIVPGTSLLLEDVLAEMLRPKSARKGEGCMDTEREILKADTSELKYLFIQPKAQGSFERRHSEGEDLKNGSDDAIRVVFIDKNNGAVTEKFFEKVAGIYYSEHANRSSPDMPDLKFSISGHYQFTDKTEEGWNKFDDEKAFKYHDVALNVTDRKLPLGKSCLCLFKITSEEKYNEILRKVSAVTNNPDSQYLRPDFL